MSELDRIEAWLDRLESGGGENERRSRRLARQAPEVEQRDTPERVTVFDDDEEEEEESILGQVETEAKKMEKKAAPKKAASPRKKKTSDDSKKRFELVGSKGTVYTQKNGQARGAAMKAANKGVKNIRLREMGTDKVHVFTGTKATLPKSEWVTRTIGDSTIVNKHKVSVKKVRVEHMEDKQDKQDKQKKTSAGKKKTSAGKKKKTSAGKKRCKSGQMAVKVRGRMRSRSKSTRRSCSRRTKSGGRRRVSRCQKGQKTYRAKSPKSHIRCKKKSKSSK